MQQTLLMLHGLTGTAEMMEQFANKISPDNCNLVIPNGTFKHEDRGYCWWHYKIKSNGKKDHKVKLTDKLLREIHESINYLIDTLPPDDKIIIGGFSQGGARAQIMLLSEISHRISGLILLGTRPIEEDKLREALNNLNPIPVLWMHGLEDEIIAFDDSSELVKILEEEGWEVTKIVHKKGHMIPLKLHDDVKNFVQDIFSDNA